MEPGCVRLDATDHATAAEVSADGRCAIHPLQYGGLQVFVGFDFFWPVL